MIDFLLACLSPWPHQHNRPNRVMYTKILFPRVFLVNEPHYMDGPSIPLAFSPKLSLKHNKSRNNVIMLIDFFFCVRKICLLSTRLCFLLVRYQFLHCLPITFQLVLLFFSSVFPRFLPSQQYRSVLLCAVHYPKPHCGTECLSPESVKERGMRHRRRSRTRHFRTVFQFRRRIFNFIYSYIRIARF